MPVVGFHLLQLVGDAQRLVDAMSLGERLPDATDGKEVADRRQHQKRLRRVAVDEVRKVHAVLQPAREDLLGVLRPERVQKHPPRIDVAGGRGDLDAIVQCRKVCGVRAAAGVARGADAGRSEEHTSVQSRQYLVCRLLLEKKKTTERNSRRPPRTQTELQRTRPTITHY